MNSTERQIYREKYLGLTIRLEASRINVDSTQVHQDEAYSLPLVLKPKNKKTPLEGLI